MSNRELKILTVVNNGKDFFSPHIVTFMGECTYKYKVILRKRGELCGSHQNEFE